MNPPSLRLGSISDIGINLYSNLSEPQVDRLENIANGLKGNENEAKNSRELLDVFIRSQVTPYDSHAKTEIEGLVTKLDVISLEGTATTNKVFLESLKQNGFEIYPAANNQEGQAIAVRKGISTPPASVQEKRIVDECAQVMVELTSLNNMESELIKEIPNYGKISGEMRTLISEIKSDAVRLIAPYLRNRYSLEEIKALTAFYKTPVSSKVKQASMKLALALNEIPLGVNLSKKSYKATNSFNEYLRVSNMREVLQNKFMQDHQYAHALTDTQASNIDYALARAGDIYDQELSQKDYVQFLAFLKTSAGQKNVEFGKLTTELDKLSQESIRKYEPELESLAARARQP